MAVTLANVDLLQKQLADCHSVLNVYKWLTDSFVLVSLSVYTFDVI